MDQSRAAGFLPRSQVHLERLPGSLCLPQMQPVAFYFQPCRQREAEPRCSAFPGGLGNETGAGDAQSIWAVAASSSGSAELNVCAETR